MKLNNLTKTQWIYVGIGLLLLFAFGGSWIGKVQAILALMVLSAVGGYFVWNYSKNPLYGIGAAAAIGGVLHLSGLYDSFISIGVRIGSSLQTISWVIIFAALAYGAYQIYTGNKS